LKFEIDGISFLSPKPMHFLVAEGDTHYLSPKPMHFLVAEGDTH
jgi:hypothetical protein